MHVCKNKRLCGAPKHLSFEDHFLSKNEVGMKQTDRLVQISIKL